MEKLNFPPPPPPSRVVASPFSLWLKPSSVYQVQTLKILFNLVKDLAVMLGHTCTHEDRQTGGQAGRQAGRQTGRWTDRQTGRQTDRGRQAVTQIGTQTGTWTCNSLMHALASDPGIKSGNWVRVSLMRNCLE